MKMSSEPSHMTAPAPALQRHALNGETMGTRYSAVFFAPADIDLGAIGAALFAGVDQVDRQMSTWKPDSDLSRLNAAPARQWHAVSAELWAVLDTAVHVGIQSGGAFDIGVGALVNAWGFGPTGQQPDAQQIRALGQGAHRAASEVLEIDLVHQRVRKQEALALDLSGIAKGYGVDAWPAASTALALRATWSASMEKCAPRAPNPMARRGPSRSKNLCATCAKSWA